MFQATAFSMAVFFSQAVGHGAVPGLARQRAARTPDMHFAPTRHVVADAMLKLARVRTDDVVYDLGSGDGRIVILAAQKYGARGVGVELDPRLLEISRQVAREGEVAHRVTFIEGDLFTDGHLRGNGRDVVPVDKCQQAARAEAETRAPAGDADRLAPVPYRQLGARRSDSCRGRHGPVSMDDSGPLKRFALPRPGCRPEFVKSR